MSGDSAVFGVRLRGYRETAGLSQEELAQRSGLSIRTIGNLERGSTRWPYQDTLQRLADGLDLHGQARSAFVSTAGRRIGRMTSDSANGSSAGPIVATTPRQLPAAVAYFTGRHCELAALTGLLDADPDGLPPAMVISAIGGTAGVGKTALAVQWSHLVAGRFPDGQLQVNLRGYDATEPVSATDALASLLRSLGVPGDEIPDGVEDRSRLYRSKLAGRRVLVLLDNARDSDQVRPLLPGDPGCVALITSRDALSGLVAADGARRLGLDLLPPVDAVALLRSLIGDGADEDPHATAELARLCGRLPLALRIAAEQAAVRRPAPLAELVAELAEAQLDSLDAGEDRADVRTVFSWSYRNLPDAAAEAFTLMSLHPGIDMDTNAAAALTGTTVRQACRALSRLQRASLIQATGPGRHGMHDLLRAYAREQVPDRVADAALTRLFDHYLAASAAAMDILFPAEAFKRPRVAPDGTTVPAMPDAATARAWLNAELASLVAMVVHAAGHGWPRHAAGVADTVFRYLLTTSHLPEAETIYDHTLRLARRSGDLAAEARALNFVAGIAAVKGRHRDALDLCQGALDLYDRCGDQAGRAWVLINLGRSEQYLHNHGSATSYYRQAIAACEATGDRLGIASVQCYLSRIEMDRGALAEASGHLQLALRVFRDGKDQLREAETLSAIGSLSLRRGQLPQASLYHEQARAIYRRLDSRFGQAEELRYLGEASLRDGECRQAISYLRQALALFRQIRYRYGEIITLRTLADALHEAGQPTAARARLRTAVKLAAETGHTYLQAAAHSDMAESYYRVRQDKQARLHWQQAHSLYIQLGAAEADQVRSRLDSQEPEPAQSPVL
jgi:tetratricopeptide (TPR) repeat protein/DNA-binding XRE family transcriptional regulator